MQPNPAVFAMGYGPDQVDPIVQLKAQDANLKAFAMRAADFLHSAFPHVPRETVDAMRDSWVAFQCTGTEAQIKSMEASRAFMAAHPMPEYYPQPKSAEEQLMELVDQRDKKQALVDQMRAAFDGMRGTNSGFPEELIPVLELQLRPLVDDLEFTEKRLSDLQRSLEQRAHAESSITDSPEKSADVSTSGAD
jgi:hypothetical protein